MIQKMTSWLDVKPEEFFKETHLDAYLYGVWHDLPKDKFSAGDLAIRLKPTGERVNCRIVEVYRSNGMTRCRITPVHLDLMFSEINPAFMYSVNEDDLYMLKRVNGGMQ